VFGFCSRTGMQWWSLDTVATKEVPRIARMTSVDASHSLPTVFFGLAQSACH
jgi:hypothetical protein